MRSLLVLVWAFTTCHGAEDSLESALIHNLEANSCNIILLDLQPAFIKVLYGSKFHLFMAELKFMMFPEYSVEHIYTKRQSIQF